MINADGYMAKKQKRMVNILSRKGWTKNEVVYEFQRVFGNDIVENTDLFDDQSSSMYQIFKFSLPIFIFGTFIFSKHLKNNTNFRFFNPKGLYGSVTNSQTAKAEKSASKVDPKLKKEIFDKLGIK